MLLSGSLACMESLFASGFAVATFFRGQWND